MLKCEACGRRMKENDVFCHECGAEQGDAVSGSTPLSSLSSVDDPSARVDAGFAAQWNTARKFVEETTLSFNVRFVSGANLSHVEILVATDAGSIESLHKKVGFVPGGVEKQLDIPFLVPKGSAGEIPFDIYFRYEEEGRLRTFCAAQKHHIYKAEQVPQAVHYHSTTNVQSGDGHANDQHVHVSGTPIPIEKKKKALWEEINAQERWGSLDLVETDSFPLPDAEPVHEVAEQTGEKKETSLLMKWVVFGWVAAGIFALLLVLSPRSRKTVPVNIIQQSGAGAQTAEITSVAKPPPAQPASSLAEPLPIGLEAPVGGALDVAFGLVGGRTEWVEGDKLRYHIRSNRDCHIALLCHQSDGTTVVLFPNRWAPESFVRGGSELFVPDRGSGFEIIVSPPFGQDTVELIACTGRNEFHRMLSGRAVQTTRGMPFIVETEEGLTRGMSVVPKTGASAEWYRDTMVVRTGPSR